jgi:hypothetical protein
LAEKAFPSLRQGDQDPILPNTIFPIYTYFRTKMCKMSYKFVKNESY